MCTSIQPTGQENVLNLILKLNQNKMIIHYSCVITLVLFRFLPLLYPLLASFRLPFAFGRAISIKMYVVWWMMTEEAGLFFCISSITDVSIAILRRHSCGALKEAWASGKKSITSQQRYYTPLISLHSIVRASPYMQKTSHTGSRVLTGAYACHVTCGSHSFVLRVYRLSTLKEMSLLVYWLWEDTLIVHCTLSPLRLIVHCYF